MDTVAEILTKKDYSNKKRYFRDINSSDENIKPLWMKVLFVIIIAMAAMGEWKTINVVLAGIPKAITLGAIALAFFCGIIKGDYTSFRKVLKPMIYFVALIVLIMLCTLVIWMLGFTPGYSIVRGSSKMVFQLISILTAVAGVYLFGREAIKLVLIGICIANGAIMVLEIPNYGFAESMKSLWHCIITFGDAYGYARSLEIHELTFMMGQFFVYYAVFAPYKTDDEKRERWIGVISSLFFFVVGMKRIAIPAAAIVVVLGLLLKRTKSAGKIAVVSGISIFVLSFYFLYAVRNGSFTVLMQNMGVDMMGRDYIWELAKNYYNISPSFTGLGFEAASALVGDWYQQGLIKQAYAFHNDILKVFLELGFYGFCIWGLVQYVVYPVFWNKNYNSETAFMYMCILVYMSVTYMTDNTAFYFWPTMGLRLFPLAHSWNMEKKPVKPKWKPPTNKVINQRIYELCGKAD